MATTLPKGSPSIQDWLIDKLASTKGFSKFARENEYKIAKNPDGEKRQSVTLGKDEIWPDVFVFDPKTTKSNVRRIGEIETEETVSIEHAKGHWDLYSKAAGGDFVLAVPTGSVAAAKQIIKQLQIECKLWANTIKLDNKGTPVSAQFKAVV